MPLVLVGTPIGNLGDLSGRAVEALRAADAICCEDTRRTGRLLQHAGVERRPLLVVNDHTEVQAIAGVLRRLALGERVAVVSDAGMPGISDPGERLVQAAVAAGYAVEVVPGPSAAITALVASGLSTTTNSPRGGCSLTHPNASASVPRQCSSWSLVSSRPIATARSDPHTAARSARVRAIRWGAS